MKAVFLRKHGNPGVLNVEDAPEPELKADEIKIKVKYAGLNWAEVLSRKGLYSWAPEKPYILGLEGAGEVVEIGKDVDNVEVGARAIYGGQSGSYAEYVKVQKEYFIPAPEYLSWKEAASFSVNFFTAWIAMFELARVRRKEAMLVNAAAGGVGTAAVQLGVASGLKVFGTCSPQKKSIIEGLGARYLSYRNFDSLLKDSRPDFILESIGGEMFKRSYKILAPLGKIVLVGATSLDYSKFNLVSKLKAWQSLPRTSIKEVIGFSKGFMGLHVGYLFSRPDLLRPHWKKMVDFCSKHKLKPVIKDAIYPMSEVDSAHEFLESRYSSGKVLIDPSR